MQETTEIEEQKTETQLTEISSEQAGEEYVLQEDLGFLTDGWNQDSDGKFAYVKDGQTVKNKVIEIDGKYYGLDDRELCMRIRFFTFVIQKMILICGIEQRKMEASM